MVNLLDSQSGPDNTMNSNDSLHFKNKLLENLNLSLWKEDIVLINLEDLPDDVKKKFEAYSMNFIHPDDYKEWNFDKIWYIEHNFPDAYKTYFATQDKEYDDGYIEKLIYLFEKNYEGTKIWHGEIRLCTKYNDNKKFQKKFKDKPFVGFIQTEDAFLKKGYGLIRLIHMNQLVNKEFGLKLYSSTLFVEWSWAEKNREKLVEYGMAKKYLDTDWKNRFSFI